MNRIDLLFPNGNAQVYTARIPRITTYRRCVRRYLGPAVYVNVSDGIHNSTEGHDGTGGWHRVAAVRQFSRKYGEYATPVWRCYCFFAINFSDVTHVPQLLLGTLTCTAAVFNVMTGCRGRTTFSQSLCITVRHPTPVTTPRSSETATTGYFVTTTWLVNASLSAHSLHTEFDDRQQLFLSVRRRNNDVSRVSAKLGTLRTSEW